MGTGVLLPFRYTSHINLQEARALKRELVKFASDPANSGLIRICLNDPRVLEGALPSSLFTSVLFANAGGLRPPTLPALFSF